VNIRFEYQPLPIHAPFHTNTARERHLFGAFGSGKTYAICAEAIAWCLEQPGIRGVIARRYVPELRDTTETVFFDILPHELYQAGEPKRAGGHYESFTFPNGSKVLFRGIDDWEKHKSLNVGFIAWDEADEFDEETFVGMSSRVRQKDLTKEARAIGHRGQITRRGMWTASNPAGHNWLYHRAVDPATRKDSTSWFRSTSFDNPHLPPEYIEDLLSNPEPWIRRYVLCQFDDFAGQIYEDWGWDTHVVEPFDTYPDKAAFWMGMDPGTRNPTAGLWVVMDPANKRLVGISEYEDNRMAANLHAAEWRRIEAQKRMNVSWRIADPNIETADRGSNMKLSDIYRRLGFTFQLGPRTHKERIPALGFLIANRRFVVTRECVKTYEAIKNYKWADLTPMQRAKGEDPREAPVKRNDHLVDCAQYLSSRWTRPLMPDKPKPEQTFSDEVHKAIRRQLRGRMIKPRSHDLGGVVL
jgi:PBSX family phage terminase large subunit